MDKSFICPKCGKHIQVSGQSLISSDYKVICPQCLSQLQVVGDYAYVPLDDGSLKLDTTRGQSREVTCPHCGHKANSNAHFCPNCGQSFDSGSTALDIAPDDVTVLPPPLPGGSPSQPVMSTGDPLYDQAVNYLATCNAVTPMMLRDRFSITDERAARLIQQLEAGGVIGPYNNGGPRQILIPHSPYNTYARYTDPSNPTGATNNADTGTDLPTTHRPTGCSNLITWFIVIAFAIYIFKSCTGT